MVYFKDTELSIIGYFDWEKKTPQVQQQQQWNKDCVLFCFMSCISYQETAAKLLK